MTWDGHDDDFETRAQEEYIAAFERDEREQREREEQVKDDEVFFPANWRARNKVY